MREEENIENFMNRDISYWNEIQESKDRALIEETRKHVRMVKGRLRNRSISRDAAIEYLYHIPEYVSKYGYGEPSEQAKHVIWNDIVNAAESM